MMSGRIDSMLVSRPSLKKALRVVRRDQCTVQLGIDPERAVVFRTPSTRVVELIQHLDGRADLVTLARRHDLPVAAVQQVVRELSAAGVLDSTPVAAVPVAAGPAAAAPAAIGPAATGTVTGRSERTMRRLGVALAEHRRRLEPDLAAWSLLDAAPDGGAAELDRRAAATVAVVGGGRLGTAIGLLVASAGIGGLVAEDDRIVRHSDRVPAGLGADDVGRPRRTGLRRRLAEVAPGTRLLSEHPAPDLVVVTDGGADRDLVTALQQAGTPHLVVGIRETVGSVGPLVEPGTTSCVRCHDLTRTDRDPAWPLVVDQLAAAARAPVRLRAVDGSTPRTDLTGDKVRGVPVGAPAVEACDAVLATLVAAAAALHLLTWLRGEPPPSIDGTVEFRLPDGHGRRRSWAPHPACHCLRGE